MALEGHSGSFVLQHLGVMKRGEPSLSTAIVPDSGSGQLEGVSGQMTLERVDGVHHDVLEYTLP